MAQKQIDEYNEKIGDNNYLINLYNQLKQHEKDFKKLLQFKILFKQIGCGGKKEFVPLIKDKNDLKETLKIVKEAGSTYFSIPLSSFINLLKNRENYNGIYWNKTAINTVSGKYFANWHDLQDKLKDAKVFNFDKKSEEQIKIPDAVELSSLFEVLDEVKGSEISSE
ncbi:MAG: hypothetical protein LBQ24_01390 [Candidatus Peribacteria bacterium]|nr:hypothetical protein [Candidatus Peribacteria bacterium]